MAVEIENVSELPGDIATQEDLGGRAEEGLQHGATNRECLRHPVES